jgi:hypothetical protein
VRLGVNPDLKPVREEDLRDTRRAARRLELRMPPLESLVRVALDVRPDAVLLASDPPRGPQRREPARLPRARAGSRSVLRTFAERGIAVARSSRRHSTR